MKIPIAKRIAKPRGTVPVNTQHPLPARLPSGGAEFPSDGNGLLESCSHVVEFLDSRSSQANLDQPVFAGKFAWCIGHLEAIRDTSIISEKSFALATSLK